MDLNYFCGAARGKTIHVQQSAALTVAQCLKYTHKTTGHFMYSVHVFGHLMTANDLVIRCSSLSWVCLDLRKGLLVFMIPEGGPGLLKAFCAVCLDLNAAAAFRSHTCRTYI